VEVSTTKPVRFSTLVEQGGKPTVYLPLSDPSKDRKFMQAVKDARVLTIKQEPTATRKDFGLVGFAKEKFVTYLIFPKSLREFSDQRVVGIKYDLIAQADVTGSRVTAPKNQVRPKKEKPKPQPQSFTIRVRVTATTEKDVRVMALNEKEARAEAEREVGKAPQFSDAAVTVKVLKVART
jgi:hypothetical protein